MKKKIYYIVLIILILNIISLGKTYAVENETAAIGIEQKQEKYYLEELLKDEDEQKEIQELITKDETTKEQKIENETFATDNTKTAINYTKPTYSDCLDGVGGDRYTWYAERNGVVIYKHDIENNTNKEVYKANETDKAEYITYHVKNDILYILYIKNYEYSASWDRYTTSYVVGINTKTDAVVYNGAFNVPQTKTYYPSFAVDGEQRFYFVYKDNGVRTFDKNGKQLYDHEPLKDSTPPTIIYLKGVSPNNKALFFQVIEYIKSNEGTGYSPYRSMYEGIQKLNNGVFVVKDNYTIYGRTFPNSWSYNPRWYFLDSAGTYAVDQYGRIAKFNYSENSSMGVGREFILDLNAEVEDFIFYRNQYPNVCQNGNDVYIMGTNNNIYKVNLKTFKVEKYLKTGLAQGDYAYSTVHTMRYYNNSIVLSYKKGGEDLAMQIELNSQNLIDIKNITYSTHSTTAHSINDIVAKYKQTAPKFNYSTSIYKTTPAWKNPYKEGSLKEQVITDTLNTLNYNRWLIGVDTVTVNSNKMSRSQKGAVILKANEKISHTPAKPSGMSDEFYKEGYDGCNAKYKAGDIYSGNVSYGDREPYQAIRGFVSDLYNVSIGSATGHRQSMLDPRATQISFGQCEDYSTASIYYNPDKTTKETFYAFPSAGNFPNTEMTIGEYWSFYINTEKTQGTVSVKLTYNGKQYKGTSLVSESGYPVISFKLPEELRKQLGKDRDNMPAGTKIQVEVLGLKDENLNNLTFKYTVDFFDMQSKIGKLGDVNADGKIDTKDARQVLLAYVGKTTLTASQKITADVNKDGKVDTKDARQILLYYVGKIKNF